MVSVVKFTYHSKMISKLQYKSVYIPIFLLLWLGLFLDSEALAEQIQYNQWITNGLVLLCFAWVYSRVTARTKKLMLYGVALAFLGEVVFSILLGMYEYRLGNVPLYVPLGHSLVYVAVFYIQKEKVIQRRKAFIVLLLYWGMIAYSSFWLIHEQDILGFICTLAIVLLLKKRTGDELFFLIMFFMVVYLELLGTYYQCWEWPDTWFSTVSFISSSNPPSGIGVFYFGFDIGCLWIYKKLNNKKWRRMQSLRQFKRL